MPDKKVATSASPQDEVLEDRVDAMMERDRPAGAPQQPSNTNNAPAQTAQPAPPALDIFGATKTAPEVSPELLEKIGIKPAQPVNSLDNSPVIEAVPATDVSFDDPEIDEAVDDIVAKEGDAVLAAEDDKKMNDLPPKTPHAIKSRSNPFKNKWVWLVLAALLLIAVFAIPATRYKILGLVIKKQVSVIILDSTTKTPVSSAEVQVPGGTAKTDGNGKATLHIPVGKNTMTVTKQYYKTAHQLITVGLRKTAVPAIKLTATGRQVPITVINKISGQPLPNAEIKILNTSAKTDKNGKATIVLPATKALDKGDLSLSGYNTASVNVSVTSSVAAANTFTLTPSGSVYFLSNENGTIDVVKTNLDGSGRKTVLVGTGKEDPNTTVLLASRDWQYLVLKAQREGAQPALHLINTATDKASEFDSGNASFNLIGWYGHGFIYNVIRNNVPTSQSGHQVLKSYDAERSQLNQLDQNQADGDTVNYAYQDFYNFYLLNNLVLYATQWYTNGTVDLGSKTSTIRGINPTGQNKKDYQTFSAAGTGYFQAALYEPNGVYYSRYDSSDNKSTFFKFENGDVSSAADVNQSAFNKLYPTYLVSPSGDLTVWNELRDGKNVVFSGDAAGSKPKQLNGLSGFKAYGWYSDNYILASKNDSELYIVPAKGSAAPIKVTDYYKSAQPLYGYGYGGL